MTVGTQAAVLATLDVTMFIEFQIPPWDDSDLTSDSFLLTYVPRFLKLTYYIATLFLYYIFAAAAAGLSLRDWKFNR